MAGRGSNFGQDYTFILGASALTSTSQYSLVFVTTASADFTVEIPQTTSAAHTQFVVGVLMDRLSATAQAVGTVRMEGVAPVYCGDSVSAFSYVTLGVGGTNTGFIDQFVYTGTNTTLVTAAMEQRGLLGMALENGQTNQLIEVHLRPQLIGFGG